MIIISGGNAQRHVEVIHTGEQFLCPQPGCSKEYGIKCLMRHFHLMRHFRLKHPLNFHCLAAFALCGSCGGRNNRKCGCQAGAPILEGNMLRARLGMRLQVSQTSTTRSPNLSCI